jgi:hypothetical protein
MVERKTEAEIVAMQAAGADVLALHGAGSPFLEYHPRAASSSAPRAPGTSHSSRRPTRHLPPGSPR